MQMEKSKRKNSSPITQEEFVVTWIVWQLLVGGIASIVILAVLELIKLQIIQKHIFFWGFHIQWVFPTSLLFAITLAQYPILRKYISVWFHRWFMIHAASYLVTLGFQFYIVFHEEFLMNLMWTKFENFFIGFFVTVAPYVVLHTIFIWWCISPNRRVRAIWYAGINMLGLIITAIYALKLSEWGIYCLIPVFFFTLQGMSIWWSVISPTSQYLSDAELI